MGFISHHSVMGMMRCASPSRNLADPMRLSSGLPSISPLSTPLSSTWCISSFLDVRTSHLKQKASIAGSKNEFHTKVSDICFELLISRLNAAPHKWEIFMGEDKDENDLLIKYGFPEDIWYVRNLAVNWNCLVPTKSSPSSPKRLCDGFSHS